MIRSRGVDFSRLCVLLFVCWYDLCRACDVCFDATWGVLVRLQMLSGPWSLNESAWTLVILLSISRNRFTAQVRG